MYRPNLKSAVLCKIFIYDVLPQIKLNSQSTMMIYAYIFFESVDFSRIRIRLAFYAVYSNTVNEIIFTVRKRSIADLKYYLIYPGNR